MILRKESNRLQTLCFRRTGFRLFRKLEGGIYWAAALKGDVSQESTRMVCANTEENR